MLAFAYGEQTWTLLDKAIYAGHHPANDEEELAAATEVRNLIKAGHKPRFSHIVTARFAKWGATDAVIRALPLRGPNGECLITEIIKSTHLSEWDLNNEVMNGREDEVYRRLWEMRPTPLEIFTKAHPNDAKTAQSIRILMDWARPLPDGSLLKKRQVYEGLPECPRIRVLATGFYMDHNVIRAIRGSPHVKEIEELYVQCKAEVPDTMICGDDGFGPLESRAWKRSVPSEYLRNPLTFRCRLKSEDGERWTRFLELLIPLGLMFDVGEPQVRFLPEKNETDVPLQVQAMYRIAQLWDEEHSDRIARILRVLLEVADVKQPQFKQHEGMLLYYINKKYPKPGFLALFPPEEIEKMKQYRARGYKL